MTPVSPVILWNKKVHLRVAATTYNKRTVVIDRVARKPNSS